MASKDIEIPSKRRGEKLIDTVKELGQKALRFFQELQQPTKLKKVLVEDTKGKNYDSMVNKQVVPKIFRIKIIKFYG